MCFCSHIVFNSARDPASLVVCYVNYQCMGGKHTCCAYICFKQQSKLCVCLLLLPTCPNTLYLHAIKPRPPEKFVVCPDLLNHWSLFIWQPRQPPCNASTLHLPNDAFWVQLQTHPCTQAKALLNCPKVWVTTFQKSLQWTLCNDLGKEDNG